MTVGQDDGWAVSHRQSESAHDSYDACMDGGVARTVAEFPVTGSPPGQRRRMENVAWSVAGAAAQFKAFPLPVAAWCCGATGEEESGHM
ncbi:MAG: hypothetical protein R3E01_04685 [Pirellulaceae bacterium]